MRAYACLRGDPQRARKGESVGVATVRTTSATCPVSGSSRAIVPAASFATHTASPLAATETRARTDRDGRPDLVGAGIDS